MAEQPFNPRDYLTFAEELAADRTDEVALRTAVGRAYYAIFLEIRSFTGVRQRPGVHTAIANALSSMGLLDISSQLGTVRHLREVADYEEVPKLPADVDWELNWKKALRNARLALTGIERARHEATE